MKNQPLKNIEKITPKYANMTILGSKKGTIWMALSWGGRSFWRPGSRNLRGGTPWSRFDSFLKPFGFHLGRFWHPLGSIWVVLGTFGLHLDPFWFRFLPFGLHSIFGPIFWNRFIALSIFVNELPFTRSARNKNMGRRNSRRDNNLVWDAKPCIWEGNNLFFDAKPYISFGTEACISLGMMCFWRQKLYFLRNNCFSDAKPCIYSSWLPWLLLWCFLLQFLPKFDRISSPGGLGS